MSLDSLPPELFATILSHVPSWDLQQTSLSLSRAIRYSAIPASIIFECTRLTYPDQAIRLDHHLRASPDSIRWIREFSLDTWTADPDVVINLIKKLTRLRSLSLWIGPSSFAPEHLLELLETPIAGLEYLSLRFRPYVQRATYFQFLKGAYFDSTIDALTKWPRESLPALSIVQDRLDPSIAQQQIFAQPIVFFRLDTNLSRLVGSHYLSTTTAFRLRIPARPVVRALVASPRTLPVIELLDLSTCNILEAEVDMLLVHFQSLRHLVLDSCSIHRGDFRGGEWGALGKRCALAGVRRAKEREKKLKVWLERNAAALDAAGQNRDEEPAADQNVDGRRTRRGRRGLATATISIRPSPARDSHIPLPARVKKDIPKVRILPEYPALITLATTTSALIKPEDHGLLRQEFENGWAEGLAQIGVARARLRQSLWNGIIRVARFTEAKDDGEGLDGLEEIEKGDNEAFWRVEDGIKKAPVLCLVGPGEDRAHVDGCGHSVGWKIWKDKISM